MGNIQVDNALGLKLTQVKLLFLDSEMSRCLIVQQPMNFRAALSKKGDGLIDQIKHRRDVENLCDQTAMNPRLCFSIFATPRLTLFS
jgi:hypothetical protein